MASWNYTLKLADIFRNEDMTFEESRDEIGRRIKKAVFYKKAVADGDYDLESIVIDIECADSVEEFDDYWEEFYNWCDDARVWVATF